MKVCREREKKAKAREKGAREPWRKNKKGGNRNTQTDIEKTNFCLLGMRKTGSKAYGVT